MLVALLAAVLGIAAAAVTHSAAVGIAVAAATMVTGVVIGRHKSRRTWRNATRRDR